MADWRDNFQQGSFRGVPFFTTSHRKTGGRRKFDHEYSKRDVGNTEDLGKKLPDHALEIYVLGDDYFAQRDALMQALDSEGPGRLVHPYLGIFQAQAGPYTLVETVDEGRIARFSVEFSEAGEIKFPDQAENDLLDTSNNADALIDNSKSAFESALDTVNQAEFVVTSASNDTKVLANSLDSAVQAVTEPVSNLTLSISELNADAEALVRTPGELADRIEGVFSDLFSVFEDDPRTAERVLGTFVASFPSSLDPIVGSTPSRTTQKNNQAAIKNIGQQIALATQAKAAVEVEFLSTEEALESRNSIVGGLEALLDEAADDDLFQSIKDVQTSITKSVPTIGVSELLTFELKTSLPAIVVAYDLFEDLDKEGEIVDQNDVEHPGFVPGGQELQVSAG